MDSTWSIGDIVFTGDPTYCDRKAKSKAEAGKRTNTCQHQEVALSMSFKTEGCGHVVHKRHTSFLKQLLGA